MAKAIFKMTKIGNILSDKSRVTMLLTLLGGPRTAGELAKSANIKPQTATSHLNKMLDCNLITKSIYGKYHYYKLASKEIASFLETIHIGGNLGKVICDNLFGLGWVVRYKLGRELKVTPLGSIQLIKNFDFTI